MGNSVVLPAHSCGKSERRGCFPLILEIGHIERASKAMAAPRRDEANVRERGRRHVILTGKTECVIRGLSLIEPNSPDLHACLEGVTAMGPDHVVDHSVRGANLNIRRIVIEANEITCTYRKGERARLGIVKRRAIHVELRLVEKTRGERVLERHQVVRGMVDGLQL